MKKILSVFILLIVLIVVSFQTSFLVSAAPVGNFIELKGGYLRANGYYPGSFSTLILDAWINPSDVSGNRPIFSIGEKSSGISHYLLGINGGSLVLQFKFGTGSTKYLSAGQISPNIWTHVQGKITPNETSIFVNDIKVLSTSGASNLLSLGSTIVVGSTFDESYFSPKFLGSLDEIKISSDTSTFIYWKLDETRGQNTAADSSGNGLSGILISGDSAIHFFGILPSPTPFTGNFPFPTSRITRPTWVLPNIGFPNPTSVVVPTLGNIPSPTSIPSIPGNIRGSRPVRSF